MAATSFEGVSAVVGISVGALGSLLMGGQLPAVLGVEAGLVLGQDGAALLGSRGTIGGNTGSLGSAAQSLCQGRERNPNDVRQHAKPVSANED